MFFSIYVTFGGGNNLYCHDIKKRWVQERVSKALKLFNMLLSITHIEQANYNCMKTTKVTILYDNAIDEINIVEICDFVTGRLSGYEGVASEFHPSVNIHRQILLNECGQGNPFSHVLRKRCKKQN